MAHLGPARVGHAVRHCGRGGERNHCGDFRMLDTSRWGTTGLGRERPLGFRRESGPSGFWFSRKDWGLQKRVWGQITEIRSVCARSRTRWRARIGICDDVALYPVLTGSRRIQVRADSMRGRREGIQFDDRVCHGSQFGRL